MKNLKLKPCPFCGNKKVSLHQWEIPKRSYFALCTQCPAMMDSLIENKKGMSHAVKMTEAVKFWNTRYE